MKKILVIDDEQTIRDTISLLLSARGFAVVTAADGLAGVKVARQEKPDLVISDIAMEPVDGFMTLSIIKQLPGTGRIPFIMVTGDRELETMRKGLTLGADDYITKPFTPEAILNAVNTQLKRREEDLAVAAEQVARLRELLVGGDSEEAIATSIEEIRDDGRRIAEMSDVTDAVRFIGEGIAKRARTLQRHFAHTRLLAQIEAVAANPDALEVLRRAAGCELLDVVEAECHQAAERRGRPQNLSLQLVRARVGLGSAALTRVVEELADNAFHYSPSASEVSVKCRVADQSVQLAVENVLLKRAPRAAAPGSRPEAGIGLAAFEKGPGIQFVRRLVEVHGGGFAILQRTPDSVTVQAELPLQGSSPPGGGGE